MLPLFFTSPFCWPQPVGSAGTLTHHPDAHHPQPCDPHFTPPLLRVVPVTRGPQLHPHSALVLAHTLPASARLRPQFLFVYKALSRVLFYLIWLFVAFLPFVLMLLSDLICIQITSPGGSPIRGKNAVRASRLATPRHCVTTTPSRPVPSVTSPIPILTSPASSPALAPQHHRPPHTSTLGHSLLWTHPLQVWIVKTAEPYLGDGEPCGPASQANPPEGLLQ